jgi:hypothetical protein
MQITTASITGKKVVFENILEDIPGGVSLEVVTRLDYTATGKEYLKAGAPLYVDLSTRIAELCKTTKSAVAIDATHLFVAAGHHFKVGDSITDASFSRIISAISASGATYDIITVPSGLVITAGTVYNEATAGAASAFATYAYTPNGLLKDDVYIVDGNASASVVKMGTVREDALDYPLSAANKIALRGGTAGSGTSLITVV